MFLNRFRRTAGRTSGRALAGMLVGLALLAPTAVTAQEAATDTAIDTEAALEAMQREIEALRQELREVRSEQARQEAAEQARASEAEAAERAEGSEGSGGDGASAERLAELERRLDILAEELERVELGEVAVVADEGQYGYGPAASKIYRTPQGLSIGGYGEMLYEDPSGSRDDGSPSGATAELDFLRAIVYFGYKFNDRWLFNSEIEFEHASTGESGSASVEFAYLDYLWRPEANLRAGILLVPMGFVNELHEPTVFLGAKRPDVERVIIPSTWRENGFGLFGDVDLGGAGSLAYRTYVVNGLDGSGFSSGGLRGGRQKGSQALAEDLAWVGRVDWSPRPGLLLGGSAYVGDSDQGLEDPSGATIGLGTQIVEAHAEWRFRGLELRALGVQAELDDVARLNAALGRTGTASVGERLTGGYLQAGYDVFTALDRPGDQELIPYVRWETYDTQDEVPTGFASSAATDVESLTLGLAYKPIDQIILKADWQDYDNGAGTGTDQFNLALGYIF